MSGLKSRVLTGARWAVGARLLRTFLGIATTGVLARFLSPSDFGIMALIGFVTALVQVFGDFGTRVALVQRREVTRIEQDSVFWSNVAFSLGVVAVVQVGATPIAAALGSAGAENPLRWTSLTFFIGALGGLPVSVLERRFAFGRIALSEVGAAVAASVAAIGFALAGFTIGALMAQALAGAVVYTALVAGFARWRPRLRFSRAALRPLLSYGGYVTAAGFVHFLSTRADRPIIGNRLSAGDLGYLAMAEQVVGTPIRVVVQMLRRVMFPVMASIQDDNARLRRAYLGAQHGLMLVMAPVALGLWALADPVVALLLGPGWDTVAALMGFMTLRSVLNSFNDFNSAVFSAKGQARFQFRWAVASAVLTIGALLVGVGWGIVGVVAARLLLTVAMTPIYGGFALRLIEQPVGEVALVLGRPILSAVLMAAAVTAVRPVLPEATALQLVLTIPLGAVVYVACELAIDRRRALPLLRQVLRRR